MGVIEMYEMYDIPVEGTCEECGQSYLTTEGIDRCGGCPGA